MWTEDVRGGGGAGRTIVVGKVKWVVTGPEEEVTRRTETESHPTTRGGTEGRPEGLVWVPGEHRVSPWESEVGFGLRTERTNQ